MTFPLTLKVSGSAGIFENGFTKLKRAIFIIMKILYSSIFWIYLNRILKTMGRISSFCFFSIIFFLSSLFFLSTSICPHCILIYSLYTLYHTDFHSLSLSLSHTLSPSCSPFLSFSLSLSFPFSFRSLIVFLFWKRYRYPPLCLNCRSRDSRPRRARLRGLPPATLPTQ